MSAAKKYFCHCCGEEMVIPKGNHWHPDWRVMPNNKDVECRPCQSDPHLHLKETPPNA